MADLDRFSNALDRIGAAMAQNIVPVFAKIAGILATFINTIAESKVLVAALTVVLGALGAVMLWTAAAAMKTAIAYIWKAVGLMSISGLGWNTLAAVAMGGAAIAAGMSYYNAAPAADMVSPAK